MSLNTNVTVPEGNEVPIGTDSTHGATDSVTSSLRRPSGPGRVGAPMHVPTQSLRSRARRIAAIALGLSMVLVVGLMPVAAFDPADLFNLEPTEPPRTARA